MLWGKVTYLCPPKELLPEGRLPPKELPPDERLPPKELLPDERLPPKELLPDERVLPNELLPLPMVLPLEGRRPMEKPVLPLEVVRSVVRLGVKVLRGAVVTVPERWPPNDEEFTDSVLRVLLSRLPPNVLLPREGDVGRWPLPNELLPEPVEGRRPEPKELLLVLLPLLLPIDGRRPTPNVPLELPFCDGRLPEPNELLPPIIGGRFAVPNDVALLGLPRKPLP